VTDQANPSDKTSTTFALHVLPDKIFANGFNGP